MNYYNNFGDYSYNQPIYPQPQGIPVCFNKDNILSVSEYGKWVPLPPIAYYGEIPVTFYRGIQVAIYNEGGRLMAYPFNPQPQYHAPISNVYQHPHTQARNQRVNQTFTANSVQQSQPALKPQESKPVPKATAVQRSQPALKPQESKPVQFTILKKQENPTTDLPLQPNAVDSKINDLLVPFSKYAGHYNSIFNLPKKEGSNLDLLKSYTPNQIPINYITRKNQADRKIIKNPKSIEQRILWENPISNVVKNLNEVTEKIHGFNEKSKSGPITELEPVNSLHAEARSYLMYLLLSLYYKTKPKKLRGEGAKFQLWKGVKDENIQVEACHNSCIPDLIDDCIEQMKADLKTAFTNIKNKDPLQPELIGKLLLLGLSGEKIYSVVTELLNNQIIPGDAVDKLFVGIKDNLLNDQTKLFYHNSNTAIAPNFINRLDDIFETHLRDPCMNFLQDASTEKMDPKTAMEKFDKLGLKCYDDMLKDIDEKKLQFERLKTALEGDDNKKHLQEIALPYNLEDDLTKTLGDFKSKFNYVNNILKYLENLNSLDMGPNGKPLSPSVLEYVQGKEKAHEFNIVFKINKDISNYRALLNNCYLFDYLEKDNKKNLKEIQAGARKYKIEMETFNNYEKEKNKKGKKPEKPDINNFLGHHGTHLKSLSDCKKTLNLLLRIFTDLRDNIEKSSLDLDKWKTSIESQKKGLLTASEVIKNDPVNVDHLNLLMMKRDLKPVVTEV